MTGIGHNQGPAFEPGFGWRKHCWKRARQDLLGKKVPLEIVRLRIKRAEKLGLSYPQYASVLMGSGRDIVGFLFTVDGLGLRLRKRLEMPDQVKDKLGQIDECTLLSLAPSGEPPETFRLELNEVSGARFASVGREPEFAAEWSTTRDAIRLALDPLKLPAKAVVMIGARKAEEQWAAAGKLAKFIPSEEYFLNDKIRPSSAS